jgi:hypothetical protein
MDPEISLLKGKAKVYAGGEEVGIETVKKGLKQVRERERDGERRRRR